MNEPKDMQMIKSCVMGIIGGIVCGLFTYITKDGDWHKAVADGVPFGLSLIFFVGTYRQSRWSWVGVLAIFFLFRIGLQHLLGL